MPHGEDRKRWEAGPRRCGCTSQGGGLPRGGGRGAGVWVCTTHTHTTHPFCSGFRKEEEFQESEVSSLSKRR